LLRPYLSSTSQLGLEGFGGSQRERLQISRRHIVPVVLLHLCFLPCPAIFGHAPALASSPPPTPRYPCSQ
jgi:hypothetical protein